MKILQKTALHERQRRFKIQETVDTKEKNYERDQVKNHNSRKFL